MKSWAAVVLAMSSLPGLGQAPDGLGRLHKGERVRVDARMERGKLVAVRVEPGADIREVTIEGPVRGLDQAPPPAATVVLAPVDDRLKFRLQLPRTFRVGPFSLFTNETTRFEDPQGWPLTAADLRERVRVRVAASGVRGRAIRAEAVRIFTESSDDLIEIDAPVEDVNVPRSEITLGGVVVSMNRETRFNPMDVAEAALDPAPASAAPAPVAPRATAAPPKASLRIPHVTSPPTIDQFLEGVPRQGEAVVTSFRQREPADGRPASQPTTAYLSYDQNNIYVVFVCKDDPKRIRARLAKREDIGGDDRVSVSFDTFHDGQRAYTFAANPLGIQLDSAATEGHAPDNRFDTLWYSRGRITGDGFIVWMAIPFKSLRFSSGDTQRWGLALGRIIARYNEVSFWPYITKRVQGFVTQMAILDGLETISAGRNIQLTPYMTHTRARILNQPAPSFRRLEEVKGGLDSKIILRDSLTLDLAVNPDFSQVESDDPQVTVNQRFEVLFPEKRPFFTENAGYFATPINLFFSRRIVDPEFGSRLTGKLGRWSLGAFAADDRAPGRRVSPADPLFNERSMNGAFRLQREFGQQSRIGVLTTSRDFGPSWNRVASIDTRLRLSPNWFVAGQAVRSFNRQPDGRKLAGPAYYAELMRGGRNFSYVGSYTDVSPDFRTPLGFVRRNNIRQTTQYAAYNWLPESRKLYSFGPSFTAHSNWDRTGRLQDWSSSVDFGMDFAGPVGFRLGRYDGYEWYINRGFRTARNWVSFYSNWTRVLSFYGTYGFGRAINYTPAGELQPFIASSTDASLGFAVRPIPRLRLEQSYFYSAVKAREGMEPGAGVFTNHLARLKMNYQFSRALSFRIIGDYYGLMPNTSLIAQEKYKHLVADVLLTYMINHGTAFYVGFNNRLENLMLDPETQILIRRGGRPDMTSSSQIFVKLSYLFRF